MPKYTILAALMLSGSTQVWAAPAPVSEAAMNPSSLEARLTKLENMLSQRNRLQFELQQQLTILQEEVSDLRGTTEEHAYRLEQLLNRQRELYQEIEERVAKAYSAPATPVLPGATTASTPLTVSSDLSENEAYDKAVALIMKDKRYDQAIPEFEAFITAFPNSVYIPNAHYWLGQLRIIKDDVKGAMTHFETVVNDHPESNKRADALLKLGGLLQKQNRVAEANQTFDLLIKEYPDSTAAKLAKDRKAQ